jgi:hypothetical protein
MIFGRPTNLWLGLLTAIQGAMAVTFVALGADPTIVATIGGAWAGAFGAVILVVAGQPPTVNEGDTINVITPPGSDNYQQTTARTPVQKTPEPAQPTGPAG